MSKLLGAAAFTHALKEHGNGSMVNGVKRIANESRQQGFQQGVNYALQRLSLLERIVGHQITNKK